jgi:hypothetical protein
MATATDQLIDQFASRLNSLGVQIRPEDNLARMHALEGKLPKRLPQSFATLLSKYSFPSFNAGGITFFGWGPDRMEFSGSALPAKGSLSELLLPAGYVQIGRPDTGDFDAVCFKLSTNQNREYRIVQADHEEILCNFRVTIRRELCPSFRKLAEHLTGLQQQ